MSENEIGVALVHEICPICGKPMNEQIHKALNKQFVDTEHLYVFDYNRSKIFHINIPINTLDEDIPNILEEYGLKESECNYMITEFPCKTINLTYEDKIVNKEDKIQNSKISI